MTEGQHQPFDQATQWNNHYLAARSGEFDALVNIGGSRVRGVIPLPARLRTDDGATTVIEYRPVELRGPRVIVALPPTLSGRIRYVTPATGAP